MADKEEIMGISDKLLAEIIVERNLVDNIMQTALNDFGQAVLDAPNDETTNWHKNRFDAVRAFGAYISNQIHTIAKGDVEDEPDVHMDT